MWGKGQLGIETGARPSAVAGRFYPSNPEQLRRVVTESLGRTSPGSAPGPKAIIAPHAGYIYSGDVAAAAYVQLAREAHCIHRIVLIGPAHFVPFAGVAASSASAFLTPLGAVPVDMAAVAALSRACGVILLNDAHAPEHCLEVQLPFLQVLLKDFEIVPLLVGESTPEQVSGIIDQLWGEPATRFVISSDLSHYLNDESARALDALTAAAIEAAASEQIGENQACGRLPVRGLLECARRRKLRARTILLRTSADAGGPADSVVGYGAFGFYEPWP